MRILGREVVDEISPFRLENATTFGFGESFLHRASAVPGLEGVGARVVDELPLASECDYSL